MPIDPTKRIGNWDEKYNLERVNAILTEKRLYAELARVRTEHPGVDLARLLEPDWRSQRK